MMKGSIGNEVTHFTMLLYIKFLDAPPNSSKYSNMNPKMKTTKEKKVGVCSLMQHFGGKKGAWSSKMEIRAGDK
jgi:hypothetical protein